MRSLILIMAIAGVLCSVSARQLYVVAKEQNTAVYQNRLRKLYEQAVFFINPDERVRVLKDSGGHLQIINQFQQFGWVKAGRVMRVSANKSFVFDSASVAGYIDSPDMAIVWGRNGLDDFEITLDRSFQDALRENVNRETIQRVANK